MFDKKRAEALLLEGMSYRAVAEVLGVHATTVARNAPGHGWTYRQGGEFRAMDRWGHKRIEKTWKGAVT